MYINIPNIPEECLWLVALCVWLAIWDFIRKWIALYKAGQKSDLVWFILIFIFNTCGILPIVYLILNKEKTNKEL